MAEARPVNSIAVQQSWVSLIIEFRLVDVGLKYSSIVEDPESADSVILDNTDYPLIAMQGPQ